MSGKNLENSDEIEVPRVKSVESGENIGSLIKSLGSLMKTWDF